MIRILLVDNDLEFANNIIKIFAKQNLEVIHALDTDEALLSLKEDLIDLILCELVLNKQTGLQLLKNMEAEEIICPTIIYTNYTSHRYEKQALELGAVEYIQPPFTHSQLVASVNRFIKISVDQNNNDEHNSAVTYSLDNDQEMIGESEDMRILKKTIKQVGPCDATVLIQGESGTGKELVAKLIHTHSHRKENKFLAVNCGAIPVELMESEFFGHVKGAFTGAVHETEGLIRQANNGTLFLDEIAELDKSLQVKLLRVLEERVVRPVGSNNEYKVNIRVIAAGNKDLMDEVKRGNMREDLYYRLNVIHLTVPPLRERGDDFILLFKHIMKSCCKKLNKNYLHFSDSLINYLMEFDWPGNVRELENAIERAIIMSNSKVLNIKDFDFLKEQLRLDILYESTTNKMIKPMSIEQYTKEIVRLYQNYYSEKDLANLLGIGRKTLWMRRNKWGIHREKKNKMDCLHSLDYVVN